MDLSLQTINWVAMPGTVQQTPRATKPLLELLDAAVATGFEYVGLETFTIEQQHIDVEKLADQLHIRELGCTDIGVLSVSAQDCREQAHYMGEIARQLGAKTCITVLSQPPDPTVVHRLRQCAEVLQEYQVTMALEFLPYGPLATLPQCIQVCELVGWDSCGVLVDTWHLFHNPPAWEHLAALDGSQIALVQLNDAPPPSSTDLVYESRFRRVPPGRGQFDIPLFVDALHETGFDGILSPEVLSTDLQVIAPEQAARNLYTTTMRTGILNCP